MATILQYSPGSQVTLTLQILNASGVRADGYSTPIVNSIILPDLSVSGLYPLPMTRISTGLYYHKFTLPSGAAGVGSYIADLSWTDHDGNPKQNYVQIICVSTGGNFSVSPN